jgi:hypothetical protein
MMLEMLICILKQAQGTTLFCVAADDAGNSTRVTEAGNLKTCPLRRCASPKQLLQVGMEADMLHSAVLYVPTLASELQVRLDSSHACSMAVA